MNCVGVWFTICNKLKVEFAITYNIKLSHVQVISLETYNIKLSHVQVISLETADVYNSGSLVISNTTNKSLYIVITFQQQN